MTPVIDKVLAAYGMKWELDTYRIVNKNGIIVQKSNFDLRETTLKAQENLGNYRAKFKKPGQDTLEEI